MNYFVGFLNVETNIKLVVRVDNDIEKRVIVLEEKMKAMEQLMTEKFDSIIDKLDYMGKMLEQQGKKQQELEREFVERIIKYNGYENKFVSWDDFEKYKKIVDDNFDRLSDRISALEKEIATVRVSDEYFRKGQSWLMSHWSEIVSLIVALLVILDIVNKYLG